MISGPDLKRVIVIGTSGSGKTTFGKRLAARLGVPHVELDSLHWGPNWTPLDEERFLASVRSAVVQDGWVVDGNYSKTRLITWPRATHIVWLDFSFLRVMYQLFLRTMRRSIGHEELFGGNRESLNRTFFSRDSILLWGLTTFHRRRRQFRQIIDDELFPNIRFIALGSPDEAERWLGEI